MKMLILGGTRFVGRHLVERALARGHEVTLFNRGQSNRALFPEVETTVGDRDGGLDALRDRRWDVAVDTCGYVPRLVRGSVDALNGAVGLYAFISTVSVYADLSKGARDESATLHAPIDSSVETVDSDSYGPLKVMCEEVLAKFDGPTLVPRPGLIVGPYDTTDRFTYWPRRVARGGIIAAPGRPEARLQVVDARDLAAWLIDALERRQTGIFNAIGPSTPITLGELLTRCLEVAGSDAELMWIPDEFLLEAKVKPFADLPLWLPESIGVDDFFSVDASKAFADGLSTRPIEDTIRGTLEWDRERGEELKLGLSPEQESQLLGAWQRESARAQHPTSPRNPA